MVHNHIVISIKRPMFFFGHFSLISSSSAQLSFEIAEATTQSNVTAGEVASQLEDLVHQNSTQLTTIGITNPTITIEKKNASKDETSSTEDNK